MHEGRSNGLDEQLGTGRVARGKTISVGFGLFPPKTGRPFDHAFILGHGR